MYATSPRLDAALCYARHRSRGSHAPRAGQTLRADQLRTTAAQEFLGQPIREPGPRQQAAELDDQAAQLDDQAAQLDDQADKRGDLFGPQGPVCEHDTEESWRRFAERRAKVAAEEGEAMAKSFSEYLSPVMGDLNLVTLAAAALSGLLARRDSPCAMNPQDMATTAAEYARATLAALRK